MYGRQQKLFREGRPVKRIIAVDYTELLAGTSLTHSVWSAEDIYEHEGHLSYTHKDSPHRIGCILHAPGQNANLIGKGIMGDIREAYKWRFIANERRTIKLNKAIKMHEAMSSQ